ncbi:MAG: OmpA family protein, partial [gamma proteobacterium symbiont of Phacoides pectinatus]
GGIGVTVEVLIPGTTPVSTAPLVYPTSIPMTNNRLAARRIASVADYLVKNGISSSMLSKKNHGESRPVASNRSERGRALNRRVEIRLVKSK